MEDNPIRKIALTLNMEVPLQAAAYAALQDIPRGKRTEYICKSLIAKQDAGLPPAVYQTIFECIEKAFQRYGAVQAQPVSQPAPQKKGTSAARKNFLGFLSTLQNEEDEDEPGAG